MMDDTTWFDQRPSHNTLSDRLVQARLAEDDAFHEYSRIVDEWVAGRATSDEKDLAYHLWYRAHIDANSIGYAEVAAVP
jgi:hypothetical protein